MQLLNRDLVPMQKKTDKKMKKLFRSELLELCKTRTKRTIADMFNFFVILAGHEMVTGAGRTTACRVKVKGKSLPTKCTKTEGHFENMSFSKKQFEDFNEKNFFNLEQTNPWNTRPLKTIIEYGPCNQEEVKRMKIEKSIQSKTFGILQD